MGNCLCHDDDVKSKNNRRATNSQRHNTSSVISAPDWRAHALPNRNVDNRPHFATRSETLCETQARHRSELNGRARGWLLANGGVRVETACEMKSRHQKELGRSARHVTFKHR